MVKSPFTSSCDVWLFRNIQTSQVIISPTRILLNSRSMAQLPPNRRLHPTALRKDHWTPLLKATFSSSQVMRQVYTRLLEYRQLRAQQPVPIDRRTMTTKARRQLEIDQVATSVADLSASCATFAGKGPGRVTISWMNQEEKVYAKEWPANVQHVTGLDVLRGWQVIEDRSLLTQNLAPETESSQAVEGEVVQEVR